MANTTQAAIINEICATYGNDERRMIDILHAVQGRLRGIDSAAMHTIAEALSCTRVQVEGVVTFYAFFSRERKGDITIRLCDDIIDRHAGLADVIEVFQQELGIAVGETSADGRFSLDVTTCIGMCDQAPAAMVNEVILTSLTPDRARQFIRQIQAGDTPKSLVHDLGDGQNAHPLIHAMVNNHIREAGEVLLTDVPAEQGLTQALTLNPADIIDAINTAGLRGRGGAGFPTGRKWGIAAATTAAQRYIICNADEGEPGTFKDRVLLTERPHLLVEGMTIAARAIGSEHGIIYLRGEYAYLLPYLEAVLQERRKKNLLGNDIGEVKGFNFELRIQLGAGAYICGEESALISSCEGLRGEPKTRPPYPVEAGYLGCPTAVNNVETYCCVARILDRGAEWFKAIGTQESSGTKLLSVCGDCEAPGVYELPYGITVAELLVKVGAQDAAAVQIGGPSGELIASDSFNRRICFEDLPTGGAIIVFASHRNILDIVAYFLDFFVEESCGYCTPCRVGNVFLKERIDKIRRGLAEPEDLDYLRELGNTIIKTSRCGLGQTSPNPVLSSMKHFPLVYAALLKTCTDGMQASFNIQDALEESRRLAKRRSTIYDEPYKDQ